MRKIIETSWLKPAIILAFVLIGCAGDDVYNPPAPPGAPSNVFGAPASLGDGIDMMLMWTAPAGSETVNGYNVYKQAGGASALKLNSILVTASSFGPGAHYSKALWFADTTYDSSSSEAHRYYITTVSATGESASSDEVACIPNSIDREEIVENLFPADTGNIEMIPTFSWDAKTGASSYFLMLYNMQDPWIWWVHRVSATSCTFKSTPGTTYLDAADDSLFPYHEYRWIIWAVNDDNCGFALDEANFVTLDPDLAMTFVNGTIDAGKYRLCWDQTDIHGAQVAAGNYTAHMAAGMFDTTIAFEISTGPAAPANPPPNCDTTFGGALPMEYSLELNGEVFLIGDTIAITYSLPISTNVLIEVLR